MDCCSFEDGLKLVKLRGESMQAAADAAPSAMISVIGLDSDKVLVPAAASTAMPFGQLLLCSWFMQICPWLLDYVCSCNA